VKKLEELCLSNCSLLVNDSQLEDGRKTAGARITSIVPHKSANRIVDRGEMNESSDPLPFNCELPSYSTHQIQV